MKFILALVLLTTSAFSQMSKQDSIDLQNFLNRVNRQLVLNIPGADRVTVQPNLTYKTVGKETMKADVYLPPDAGKQSYPAVILIHGGVGDIPVKPKDWGIYTSMGRGIAASGLAAVAFNQRLSYPQRRYEEGAQDIKDLIAYLRKNAASLQIDPDRLCLVVLSGSGPMLSLVLRESLPYMRCAVALYSFLDTKHVDLKEARLTADVRDQYSPLINLKQFPQNAPPLLLIRSGKDALKAVNESIDLFIPEALRQNILIEILNHPTGEHGFDHANNDETSKRFIRRWIGFMKEHLTEDQ